MSGKTVSYEKRFYEWLSTQVTCSQILDVCTAIEELNDYCIRKRLLAKPLLETDDVRTLSKIKEKIERSKVFTFVYGRGRKASMVNAIHYYIRFTKLDRAKQKEVAENKLTTVESHNIEENMKPQECVASDSTVGENVTDVVDEDLKQESNLSEIDKLLNEDFYLPLRVALKNEKIVTIQELRDLKLWAFMNRNDIYLISARREVYEAVQNRLFSLDEDLNGALSEESEKKFSQNDDIILEQLPLEQETQESSTKVDRYTFYHYLLDTVKLSRSTATSYSHTIEECENFARNNNLSTCRLYLTSPTEAASTVHELEQSKDFAEINNLQHHRFSAALAKFSEFIGTSSVFAEEQPNKTPSRQAVQSFDDADASRVEKLVLDADMDGTTYEQLRDRIGTTLLAVKGIVQTNKSIVEIKGKLYHEKAFVDWEDGAKQLCDIIEKMMQRNDDYITSSQLFDSVHIEMHMFLNDNGLDDEKSVYDLGRHLFEKNSFGGHSYVFTGGTHISKSSNAISNNFDAAYKFAEDHDGVFNEAYLIEYFKKRGLNTGNIHGIIRIGKEPHFFMYDPDEKIIISAKSMQINDSWLDQVRDELNRLWTDLGDHVILRELHPMWLERLPRLPKNLPWTPMLLQGVVKFYGDKLGAKTICAMDGQNIYKLHAMLVKSDSEIQNFGDAVICYLTENEISQRIFEAEELRRLMIRSKMIKGNELIYNMPKALGNDERFAWNASGEQVKIRA